MTRISQVLIALIALAGSSCSERRPLYPVGPVSPVHGPWEDAEAENLAWLVSGEVYASKPLYDRIRSDLLVIRNQWGDSVSAVRSVTHVPWSHPRLILYIEQQVRDEMVAGTYRDWDSLNYFYGAHVTPTLAVVSEHRVNARRMAESYRELRGITNAEPSAESGDRSNVYACLYPWGIGYVFRVGWGDCFVNCSGSEVYYFRSMTAGIDFVGSWQVDIDSQAKPEWWMEAIRAWDLYRFGEVVDEVTAHE